MQGARIKTKKEGWGDKAAATPCAPNSGGLPARENRAPVVLPCSSRICPLGLPPQLCVAPMLAIVPPAKLGGPQFPRTPDAVRPKPPVSIPIALQLPKLSWAPRADRTCAQEWTRTSALGRRPETKARQLAALSMLWGLQRRAKKCCFAHQPEGGVKDGPFVRVAQG